MNIIPTTKRLLLATSLLGALGAPGLAQDEGDERFRPRIDHLMEPQGPQDELRALFREVELTLNEIDDLLSDASTGKTGALADVGESGIDKLLKRSMEGGESVVKNIDRILEIAAQNGGT